jgi:hypothetical protein
VPTVDAEISIGGKKHWIGHGLGHADEAGVGETHRNVRIFVHQPENALDIVTEAK